MLSVMRLLIDMAVSPEVCATWDTADCKLPWLTDKFPSS
jgi:hypothetical protein